jgi:hypothetical protein
MQKQLISIGSLLLILKYASKRNAYKPPAYRARNELAALDHNAHCGRAVTTNKDGTIR